MSDPDLDPARRMKSTHVVAGAIACLLLPGLSWIDGSGRLSYTMFADVHWYRIDAVGWDGAGGAHAISPARLGQAAGGSAAAFFAGAEVFRRGAVARTPRAHLADVAALACTVGDYVRVEVSLLERETRDGPETRTSAFATCPR